MNSRLSGYYPVGGEGWQIPGNAVLVDQVVDFSLQLKQFRRYCLPLWDLLRRGATENGNADESESKTFKIIHGKVQKFGCHEAVDQQQPCQFTGA